MKIYIGESQLSLMLTQLCSQILSIQDQFKTIVGIERGGVPISTWLAYVLNKEHITVSISFRDGNAPTLDEQRWYHFANTFEGQPLLIVDDIVDSGKTIDFIRQVFSRNKLWIATLHWCPENSPNHKPDFFVEQKCKEDWIVYPWEA